MRINKQDLALVMAMIGAFEADDIFSALQDDEALVACQDIRKDLVRLQRQCAELCELMPHKADQFRFQLDAEQRAIERRVTKLMRHFPWKYLAIHASAETHRACALQAASVSGKSAIRNPKS